MADSPHCADHRGARDTPFAADDCRDRDHVVGVRRMLHPEHEAQKDQRGRPGSVQCHGSLRRRAYTGMPPAASARGCPAGRARQDRPASLSLQLQGKCSARRSVTQNMCTRYAATTPWLSTSKPRAPGAADAGTALPLRLPVLTQRLYTVHSELTLTGALSFALTGKEKRGRLSAGLESDLRGRPFPFARGPAGATPAG